MGRSRPRLETVLDVVNRIHGGNVLLDLLSDLYARPNGMHEFFARHLLANGGHLTANFDICIEEAGRHLAGRDVDLLHALGGLAQRWHPNADKIRPLEVVAEVEKMLSNELDRRFGPGTRA